MPRVQIAGSKPFVAFYSSNDMPYYDFANYARKPLLIKEPNGTTIHYPTPEHRFQAQKIVHADANRQAQLRAAFVAANSRANDARKNVQKFLDTNNCTLPANWHKGGSVDAMLNVIRERVQQDPAFKKLLISTGTEPIVEDTGGADYEDNTWGCGSTGLGKNHLGICLMQVRAEINGTSQQLAAQQAQTLYASVQTQIQKLNRPNTHPTTLLQVTQGVTVLPAAAAQTSSSNTKSLHDQLRSLVGTRLTNTRIGNLDISLSQRDHQSIVITGKNRQGEGRRLIIKPNGNTWIQCYDGNRWNDTDRNNPNGPGSEWSANALKILQEKSLQSVQSVSTTAAKVSSSNSTSSTQSTSSNISSQMPQWLNQPLQQASTFAAKYEKFTTAHLLLNDKIIAVLQNLLEPRGGFITSRLRGRIDTDIATSVIDEIKKIPNTGKDMQSILIQALDTLKARHQQAFLTDDNSCARRLIYCLHLIREANQPSNSADTSIKRNPR